MPQYDGLYALKKIREIDTQSTVIVVTGGASPVMNNVESLNPTKIILKPTDVNMLVEAFW